MNKLTKIYQKRRLYDRNLIIKIASLTTHDSRSFEIFLTNFPHQHGKKTQLVSYDDSLTLIHIIARHEDFVDRRCEREIATNTLERVFLAMLFIYNFSIACVCKRAKFNWWRKNIKAAYRGKFIKSAKINI